MNSVFTSKADGVVKDKGSVSLLRLFPKTFFWEGRRREGAGRVSSRDLPRSLRSGWVARHGSEEPGMASACRTLVEVSRDGSGGSSLRGQRLQRAGNLGQLR